MKGTVDKFFEYTNQHRMDFYIGTVMPVSLQTSMHHHLSMGKLSHSLYSDQTLQEQQKLLEQALSDINMFIVKRAGEEGATLLNSEKEILKSSIKTLGRQGKTYKKLYPTATSTSMMVFIQMNTSRRTFLQSACSCGIQDAFRCREVSECISTGSDTSLAHLRE